MIIIFSTKTLDYEFETNSNVLFQHFLVNHSANWTTKKEEPKDIASLMGFK